LVGSEHHAEDVVSRALIKWTQISPEKRGVARIEQVIKSEAYSVLRSEIRRREREARATRDPTLVARDRSRAQRDLCDLRRALGETVKRHAITITSTDVEVLELLFAGLSLSTVVKITGLNRYHVRRSRATWQRVLDLTDLESAEQATEPG
jgi:hypothetical protein